MESKNQKLIYKGRHEKIATLGFVLSMAFNYGAFLITVYMLRFYGHLVYESNAFPAMVFSEYGYFVMFVILTTLWVGLLRFLVFWRRRYGERRYLFFLSVLVIILLPLTYIDFVNNIIVLFKII